MRNLIAQRGEPVGEVQTPLARATAGRDAKSALLAFMAHEFRQPLMAIGGVVELMRDTQLSADQRDMLDVMRRGVAGLDEIVTNVLDLARLEAGGLQVASSPFDVHATVESCIDLLAVRAAERDLELVYRIDPAVPSRLVGDGGRFRQVLINLVGNALKYTERGGVHLAVTGKPQADEVFELAVAVADTGPGLSEEQIDCLFQPFAIGEHACGYGDSRTGLGLSICQELVELMGGRIWAESELGKGSTFRFTVEVRAIDEARSHQSLDPDLIGKRLLVVDDSALAGQHVVELVEGWGGSATAVTGGAQALARLRAGERYDAILVDGHMPGLDGRALAAEIRAVAHAGTTPLILMTTLQRKGRDVSDAMPATRFAAYVSKPVKPARLREVVGAVLAAVATTPEVCARGPKAPAVQPDDSTMQQTASGPLAHARILVVDDDPDIRRLLERVLRRAGATITGLSAARPALDHVRRERPDLVILDALMPEMDGFEACRRLKHDPATRLIPVLLATGMEVEELRIRALEAGADDLLGKPFDLSRLVARVQGLVRAKGFTDGLEPAETVIVAMAQCIEGKDPNTHGHCERLAEYAERLGQRLELSEVEIEALRLAGIVHDIGKVAVPDAILLKPGPLTDDEWEVMRRHPTEGERICAGLASFRRVLPIIRHHHERFDGAGYPDRLCGEEIPLTARVLQIVDIYDALTTKRPYRVPLSPTEALDHIAAEVEKGWRDPHVFAVFREMVEESLAATDAPELTLAASA
ncbi:MAG: response regulator [Gemmatimonadota bacterium]|nr:response regulator [Gemmatimonadota bacterium]